MVKQSRRQHGLAGHFEAEIVNTQGALENVQFERLIFQIKKLRSRMGKERTRSHHRGS